MLTKINLVNFKSFLNTSLVLNPLTVLTGLNNSGKSSIIQAINMIFMYYKSGKQTIKLEDHISPRLLKTKLSKENFFNIKLTNNSEEIILQVATAGEGFGFSATDIQNKLPDLCYISASRLGPQNVLRLNSEDLIPEIGTKGEHIIDYIDKNHDSIINEALVKNDKSIPRLWENINTWLQYISPGTELSYDMRREQNASYPYYNAILPSETGFGLSYTLPIITALLVPSSENGSLVMLENPEAHLHPKGQTAIGELIALTASTGKQIIVETHSDHLIDGIRIAARKQMINANDVIFHYATRDDYEGETKIETPVLQQDGKLSFWPKGFFDQGLINKAELVKR